jgi:hypothetical protein
MTKKRLSASVDTELMAAAERAVARGGEESLSAWVNEAFRLKVEHDERLKALGKLISEHESAHGVISVAEMRAASRRADARARRTRPKTAARRGARVG